MKAYHWVATPLALHGVICKKDGTTVDVVVGEDPADPVFCISDLLIHLAGEQMEKPAGKAVDHENLDVIVGGRPVVIEGDDEAKEPVKQMFLDIIKEKYDIEEEDFLSAEIEVVPAGPAREMGFDRSMILGHGQDDRVCAYTSLAAQLDVPQVETTSVTLLVDKEEIGSVGASGMTSRFFENSIAEIMALAGEDSPLALRRCLANSRMLSSDVSAGFDHLYADRFEKKNAAIMGHGLCFNKYTGARGKSGSNDADAEYFALIRDIMDEAASTTRLRARPHRWRAAAAPSPISWPSTAWTSSTPAWRSSPCTRFGRPPTRRTSSRPTRAIRPLSPAPSAAQAPRGRPRKESSDATNTARPLHRQRIRSAGRAVLSLNELFWKNGRRARRA